MLTQLFEQIIDNCRLKYF